MHKKLNDIDEILKNTIIRKIPGDNNCSCGVALSSAFINPSGSPSLLQCSNCQLYIIDIELSEWVKIYRYYDFIINNEMLYIIKKEFFVKLEVKPDALHIWEDELWINIDTLDINDIQTLNSFFEKINTDEIRYIYKRLQEVNRTPIRYYGVSVLSYLLELKGRSNHLLFYKLFYYSLMYYPLEALVKTGFNYLIDKNVLFLHKEMFELVINPDGKTISEIIDIPKNIIKILVKNQFDFYLIIKVRRLINEFGPDSFRELFIRNNLFNLDDVRNKYYINNHLDSLTTLLRNDYKPKMLVDYLSNLIKNRGRDVSYWLGLMIDIYRNSDIVPVTKKYPKDLLAYHDDIMAEYQEIMKAKDDKDSIINKKLQALQNNSQPLIKQVVDADYIVKVPGSIKELQLEGKWMNHCVSSYARDIAKGNTLVLFVRRKSISPGYYMTLQIVNNCLIQARGYRNRAPNRYDMVYLTKLCQLNKWDIKV